MSCKRILLFAAGYLITYYASAQASDPEYFSQVTDSLRMALPSDEAAADTLEELGKKYRKYARFDMALAYFNESLMLREEIGSQKVNRSYLYLGSLAGERKDYRLSIEHFKKAAELSKEWDSLSLSQALNSMSLSYTNMAELDSALKYQRQALRIKQEIQVGANSLLSSYLNLSHLFNRKAEKTDSLHFGDSARYYVYKVLNHPEASEYPEIYALALQNMGFFHYTTSELDSAKLYYHQALKISRKDSLIDALEFVYDNLAYLYADLKHDSTRYFIDKSYELKELIYSSEMLQRVQEYRTQYQVEKTERELATKQLELERQESRLKTSLLSGGAVILVMTGLLGFLFYRQRIMEKLRQKDEDLHKQKVNELIRDQEISILSARVEGQDTERQRISEDLHDHLGSKLSAVKLYYDAARENPGDVSAVEKARILLDETIAETRRIAHNLSSGVLTRFGLVAAVKNLQETLEQTKKIDIEFIAHGMDRHEMSKDLEINFYRIIQELISNILKHAGATQITIQLTRHSDGLISLIVEDNGKGFNTKNISLNSMGLENLKGRVRRFDGNINIDTQPGYGTTVIVEINEKEHQVV